MESRDIMTLIMWCIEARVRAKILENRLEELEKRVSEAEIDDAKYRGEYGYSVLKTEMDTEEIRKIMGWPENEEARSVYNKARAKWMKAEAAKKAEAEKKEAEHGDDERTAE